MNRTLLPANYTFNATAKTIKFTGIVPTAIEYITEVFNATTGQLYFKPDEGSIITGSKVTTNGSYVSPTLTLTCDTSNANNTDRLIIIVDDGLEAATDAALQQLHTDLTSSGGAGAASASNQNLEIAALGQLHTDLTGSSGGATSGKQDTQIAALGTLHTDITNLAANIPAPVNGAQPVELMLLNYPNSTGNNSTAQLAAGATFTGNVETVLNLQAAQVEVTCDQPYTVTINQYIDAAGLQLSSSDVFTRTAGQPLNENVTLPGNYFRLLVQNTGSSTTTTLNINTTFGIMDTIPRALSNLGNFKVAVQESVLPTGAATAANQVLSTTALATLHTDLTTTTATAANQSTEIAALGTLHTDLTTPSNTVANVSQYSGSSNYNLSSVGQYNAVSAVMGGIYTFAVSNPIFQPLSSYTVAFEGYNGSAWSAINVSPRTTPLNGALTNNVSHSNSTLSQVAITSNALTTIGNHGFSVGQQLWFGVAAATANAYIPGITGPLVTACNTTTGVFTAANNYVIGQVVNFSAVSATGIAAATNYYIETANSTTFTISSSPGGATIVPTAFTSATVAGLWAGQPYYVVSCPTTSTFTVGLTPTTALTLNGTPVMLSGSSTQIATTSGLAANVITTSAAHGYQVNQQIVFGNVGSITGITANTIYYVNTVPSTTTFTIAATSGGATLTLGGAFTGSVVISSGSAYLSSVATPTLTTTGNHGLSNSQPLVFSNVGSLTGVSNGITYYAVTTASATTFTLSTTPGGSPITLGGSTTGAVLSSSSITATTLGVGLYSYQAPYGVSAIRARLTALSNLTNVYAHIDAMSPTVTAVKLPFTGGSSIPLGTPVIPIIETSSMTEQDHELVAITGTYAAWQSNDDQFQYFTQQAANLDSSTATAATISAAGVYRTAAKSKYFKTTFYTASAGILVTNNALARIGSTSTSFQPVFVTGLPTVNATQWGGTNVVTGGVNGMPAVGGNIAVGTARTANPVPVGGQDINSMTRAALYDVQGSASMVGPGETIGQFSLGTGAASVTDGTNGKNFYVEPRESDVYIGVSAISTSPTMQLEGSYDGVNFAVIPMSRLDTTASSSYFTSAAAFTPVAGAIYKGKTYGFNVLRTHLTAGSASNTIGMIRVVPLHENPGVVTVSPFALTATSTVEAVGSANGQVYTGGVRTLSINSRGSAKAELLIDAVTGTMTVALEGTPDGGTTWNALTVQPIGGGAGVTSISFTGTAALPQSGLWEADISTYTGVRAHCTAYTGGTAFGGLKIIAAPTEIGLGNSIKPSFSVNIQGATPTSANYNLAILEASATKRIYLKSLRVWNPGSMTGAQKTNYALIRQTAAGSGTTGTAQPRDNADSFGGTYRIAGSTNGAAGVTVYQFSMYTPAALAAYTPYTIDFTNCGTEKGIIVPVGTANGLYLQAVNGAAGAANVDMTLDFTEE